MPSDPAVGMGMIARFTSDGSVTRGGFAADVTCVAPSDPFCANTNLILDCKYTGNLTLLVIPRMSLRYCLR